MPILEAYKLDFRYQGTAVRCRHVSLDQQITPYVVSHSYVTIEGSSNIT